MLILFFVAMKTNKTLTAMERYELARERVADAEKRGLSTSTVNKRYRELFAAEDAVKAAYGVWA